MDVWHLLLLLYAALAPFEGDIQLVERRFVPVQVGNVYHQARGVTWCYRDGRYRVVVARGREGWERTLAHELIHAYDCAHNGRVDGSPGHPRPAQPPEWFVAHEGDHHGQPSAALPGSGGAAQARPDFRHDISDDGVLRDAAWTDLDDAHWYVHEVFRTGRLAAPPLGAATAPHDAHEHGVHEARAGRPAAAR